MEYLSNGDWAVERESIGKNEFSYDDLSKKMEGTRK